MSEGVVVALFMSSVLGIPLFIFWMCAAYNKRQYEIGYRIREETYGSGETKYIIESYEKDYIDAWMGSWGDTSYVLKSKEEALEKIRRKKQEEYDNSVVSVKHFTAKDKTPDRYQQIIDELERELEAFRTELKDKK